MKQEAILNGLKRGVTYPVYLLYGTETYLRDELVRNFLNVLLPIEVRDFNLDIIDGREKGLLEVLALAQTLPFMVDKRLIIVKDAQCFKAKKKGAKGEEAETVSSGEEEFIKYLENPSPTTIIIFLADEGIDKRKKVFTVVSKQGQVVEFSALQDQELREWVKKAVGSQGKKIEQNALERLIHNAGHDLNQIRTEIDKLVTYLGFEEIIKVEAVEALVPETTDYNVFQIIDEVGRKNYLRAIKIIREMVFLGEQPLKILQMVAKQYRLMLQIKELLRLGYSEKQIAEITASHSFVIKKGLKAAKNFSQEELESFIRKTKDFDYKIKSGQLEPSLALELYLMS